MENNICNFGAASVLLASNFQTDSNTSKEDHLPKQRVVHWRSKLVPGLERVLFSCPCGCGCTYDELGNWSKALQEQSPDLASMFHCLTSCCRTVLNRGDTTQIGKETSNHKPMERGNIPGRVTNYHPQQSESVHKRNICALERVFNQISCHCNSICDKKSESYEFVANKSQQTSGPSIEEYKGELPADHEVYALKLKQIVNEIDCKKCYLRELLQKARRREAFQWNVNKRTMKKATCGIYTALEGQAEIMFEYSQRVHKFYKMMRCKPCRERYGVSKKKRFFLF